jgi:hypothetical protein
MRKLCLFSSLIFLIGLFVACTNTVANKNQINTDSKDKSINLYFSDSNAEYLIREEREIEDLTPQKAIEALIEGPKSKKLYSSLPKELEVSRVSVEEGIAYVYIHESVPLYRHGNYGSSASVLHIINSITATLILHEPFSIEKVKLEGDISDLLYGVDTNELLDVDMNLIRENSAKRDSISAKPSDYSEGGEIIEPRVQDFFPKNPMKKYFSGGFENAGFTETIDKLAGDKVQVKWLNTGTGFASVYELKEEDIRRIFRTEENDGKFKDDYIGTTEDNSNDIILKAPLVVGTKWTNDGEGKYEITGVNVKAQTPAGTFYTVEVTYTKGEFVKADYYAKDLGLVKSSIILKDDLRMDDLLIKVE